MMTTATATAAHTVPTAKCTSSKAPYTSAALSRTMKTHPRSFRYLYTTICSTPFSSS